MTRRDRWKLQLFQGTVDYGPEERACACLSGWGGWLSLWGTVETDGRDTATSQS